MVQVEWILERESFSSYPVPRFGAFNPRGLFEATPPWRQAPGQVCHFCSVSCEISAPTLVLKLGMTETSISTLVVTGPRAASRSSLMGLGGMKRSSNWTCDWPGPHGGKAFDR